MTLFKFTVLLSLFFTSKSGFAQIYPGFDIIGKGYNVFDEFANNKSITRYPLFDFSTAPKSTNPFGHSTPQLVSHENISDHIVTTIQGTSIREYSKRLTDKIGLSGEAFFFRVSVESQFEDDYSESEEKFFFTYMDVNTKWRVNLDTRNKDTLRKYLDAQFKKDLSSMAPKELFDLYGTHFITSAFLGGRIDYSAVSQSNGGYSSQEVIDAIEGRYFKISGNYEESSTNALVLKNTKTKTHLNVVGGNAQYARSISNHEQYERWAEGISSRPVLCGFDDNSLVPIWELCSNALRRKELETYFLKSILPSHPLPQFFKSDPILDETEIYKPMKLNLVKFKIHEDCDAGTLLLGDEPGEFKFDLHATADGKTIFEMNTEGNYTVWGGNELFTGKDAKNFNVKLGPNSTITVSFGLWEVDDFSDNETVGNLKNIHRFPYNSKSLSNHQEGGFNYYVSDLYHSSGCYATFYYQLIPTITQTEIDFGNKGWEEFLAGNYEQSLAYSKEALSRNNSLGYVQYNVALVYLVQGNPMAFEKYKMCATTFPESVNIEGALKDIKDYEKEHGELPNSEAVKLLLKSSL